MRIDQLYSLFLQYPTVCTDTRKLSNNCLFFALKGGNFNGNLFAKHAIENGAAYAIIDEAPENLEGNYILVEDVLSTLQALAQHHRKQLAIPVIAIVGSNGKTTTKELVHSVLSQAFKTLSTPGNFNNHIGLPLTLLMLDSSHEIAVIEMGANHEGENKLLCDIAQPTLGLVTNNGKDHLEGFGSLEGVIRSNAELFDYFETHENGIAFVNSKDETLMLGSNQLKNRITYSTDENCPADYQAKKVALQPTIKFEVNHMAMESHLSGDYNLENIMAAVAIGFYFNMQPKQIAKGIGDYKPKNLRSEYLETVKNKIFLDAYNANPSSMMASIRNFAALPGENKVYILGDMFELGKYEAEEHQNLITYCENLGLHNVWLIGHAFAATKTRYLQFKDTEELLKSEQVKQLKDHFVFIKGSRGMRLESTLAHL